MRCARFSWYRAHDGPRIWSHSPISSGWIITSVANVRDFAGEPVHVARRRVEDLHTGIEVPDVGIGRLDVRVDLRVDRVEHRGRQQVAHDHRAVGVERVGHLLDRRVAARWSAAPCGPPCAAL